MEVQKPILNLVSNFDATKSYSFEFTYLGSERIITNELSIRENIRAAQPVYTQQSTKFDKIHILSNNILNNGTTYAAKVRVLINEDNWSEWSDEVIFTCLAQPNIVFQSIQDGKFVYNDEIMMTATFQQAQGDKVDTFRFILMDQNKIPITKYPVRKTLIGTPNIMQERIGGLVKGKLYYIGCEVRTVNRITHFATHEFIPHFVAPSVAGIVETYNQPDDGQVLVQGYLKQTLGIQTTPHIIGSTNDSPINYIYIGGEWVIIPPDKPLKYDRLGMAKASDWVAKIWLKNIPNGVFLDFATANNNGIGMKFIKYDEYVVCEKEYLNDEGLGVKSRTISNIVPNLKSKEYYLYIKVIEYRVQMFIEVA